MSMWARIDDDMVAEIITHDPAGCYHPDLVWLPVPAELAPWVDDTYISVGGVVAPPSVAAFAAQAAAAVARRRYAAETGGVVAGERRIATDRDSQALITGAYTAAAAGTIDQFDFKSAGGWVTFDAAAMIAIGQLVATHVQSCFSRERAICDLITAAATVADVLAVLTAELDVGWP